MHRKKSLAIPAYTVAFLLVFFPILDTSLSVWPIRAGDVAWRFGTFGLFSRALLTPLLGLLLAFALALLLEARRVLRGVSILSGVVAIILICGVVLFLLDALQMRVQVRPEAQVAFDVATAVALAKYGLGIFALTAFAVTGWVSSRRESGAAGKRVRERDDSARLVRSPTRS